MRRQQGVTQLLRAVAPVASRPLVLSKVAKQARQAAVAAQAAATSSAPDHGGTVYPVNITNVTKYSNVDGGRIDDGRYTNFKADVGKLIPEERLYTDPVKTFAYGTDASIVSSRKSSSRCTTSRRSRRFCQWLRSTPRPSPSAPPVHPSPAKP